MKRDVFVETEQISVLRAAVREALEAGLGWPSLVMAWGDAGTGKTIAARKLYVEVGGYYLRALEGMSQCAFLQDLCYEVTGTRPHRSADAKQAIIRALGQTSAPIFLDEIDRLPVGRMEDLRDINDLTGAPIVLIGEGTLPTKVAARERIDDRIPETFRVHFGAVSHKDIMLFARQAANLTLEPEATRVVFEATRGVFRRLHNAVLSLERAARAKRTETISGEMAAQILRPGKRQGGRHE